MSTRAKFIVAGLVVLVGVVAIVIAVTRSGGVRGYLADNYTRTGGSGDSVEYRSDRPAETVYRQVADRHPPADRIVRGDGYYLRYSDDIVVITPDGRGSRIYIDDEDRGYNRWFGVVGGRWGTFGGVGDSFRGGGPGSGK